MLEWPAEDGNNPLGATRHPPPPYPLSTPTPPTTHTHRHMLCILQGGGEGRRRGRGEKERPTRYMDNNGEKNVEFFYINMVKR